MIGCVHTAKYQSELLTMLSTAYLRLNDSMASLNCLARILVLLLANKTLSASEREPQLLAALQGWSCCFA